MRKYILITSFLVLAFSLFGQPPRPPMDPEMREQLRTIRKWRLLEELALTEIQSDEFVPLITSYENDREKLSQSIEELQMDLEKIALDENGENKKLSVSEEKQLLSKTMEITQLQQEYCLLETEFVQDASEILDPIQLYTLVTFEHRFHMEIRQLLRKFWGGQEPSPPDDFPKPQRRR